MNGFRAQQGELIDRSPQRLRKACGALCVAAAMTGPTASAEDGDSHGVQIGPADAVTAPAIVSGAPPPPPPIAQVRIPEIRPGVASHPADATAAHEIRIDPENGTHRNATAGPGLRALPIISPNVAFPAPVVLGGLIEIVPQENAIEGSQRGAADPAEPREPRPADPPEVQILPEPQESDYVELPPPN